ncbi:MAG: PEP/pyruvate-binding domain-containing protein [bacterium]
MYTIPIRTAEADLEIVGGKGRSLARMATGGYDVPPGFLVSTNAYRGFVENNGLRMKILDLAKPSIKEGTVSFETAAEKIQALFDEYELPDELIQEVGDRYGALDGEPAVAVRSSANAEDLPDLSFAGQQETFLNVRGHDAVVAAIRDCWASLWNAQAISYRHRNGIDQASVAMAVVVQVMVTSEVSGILFTTNPASGERSEMIVNASFGLGEAVVSGQVSPDTYIVDRATRKAKETMIGPKEIQIVADGDLGTKIEEVGEDERAISSLTDEQLGALVSTALDIEHLQDDVPQDIEWAFSEGKLWLLQSRPITNLPVQPIEVEWVPTPPARLVSRRQIVENMPEPICPLFEELYLTRGLESARPESIMAGGGPMFVTVNGYAYQRFDWPFIHKEFDAKQEAISEATIEAAELDAMKGASDKASKDGGEAEDPLTQARKAMQSKESMQFAKQDLNMFRDQLAKDDRAEFDDWVENNETDDLAYRITMPESTNPTYTAFNKTAVNDKQLKEWKEVTVPRLTGIAGKWRKINVERASDAELLEGIVEMGIEEGYYWSSNASHTFGVAKSTDDQLQCFLKESLPDHNFISGQFLSGFASKAMEANADLFEIAKLVQADEDLTYLVVVTPAKFLMQVLEAQQGAEKVKNAVHDYLDKYGHQGYSLDFVEPTQKEDQTALFATLKSMVGDKDYDPKNQSERAAQIRAKKMQEISELLSGLEYWQFRYRLWLARRYNYIREEVAFYFGYSWSILRPFAFELGRRLVQAGTFKRPDDIFFMVTDELEKGIEARAENGALPELGKQAAERRELREARKRHHPPGTLPAEASELGSVGFKETQIKNDESSDTLRGFAVSSGCVTGQASVVLSPSEFEQMKPGTILVSPLTTPAWTQLFSHAIGLVTDVGSILAHGSIVAREYGIPAVLGVGNGTQRIKHGQTITIDGDAGTVVMHDEVAESA